MATFKILWTLIKNPKNLCITFLAVLVIVLGISTYHYKGKVTSIQLKYEKQENAEKQAMLDMAKKNQDQINIMTSKWKTSSAERDKLAQEIAKLKEGKCNEKDFYLIADRIAVRYNGLH